jgi:outer membrane protein insertion porin family
MKKLILSFLLFFYVTNIQAVIIKDVIVEGNNRVSKETIQMFAEVNSGDDINQKSFNDILKNLYKTNFFKNVSLFLENDILKIAVEENPVVENYYIEGIKNKTLLESVEDNILFKAKSSFDISLVKRDVDNILLILKNAGY